jgi:hypothetical protein
VTQEPGSWRAGSAAEPAHPESVQPESVQPESVRPEAPHQQPAHQESLQSGMVQSGNRPGYLPAVDPVPAPVLPPGVHPGTGGSPAPWPVPPPPPEGRWRPDRVEAVPGTQFGVVHLKVTPLSSGLAAGSLMAGIASVLVSFLVPCFGMVGVSEGWGAWVAGAFAVLGGLAGGAAVGLGLAALRQIRRSGRPGLIRFTGRGTAIGGIACGGAGLAIAALSLLLVVLLQLR